MKCSACQHDNETGSKFCSNCGSPLLAKCANCGSILKPGSKFCAECGAPTVAIRSVAPPLARRAVDYTPKHLADKILQSKSALEGERKQVTVLFADVKGSMELAEQLDPEQWHRILDRFFQILSEGVHRFEGTVNQYTGDGIMALFGAPIAHEDHAQRACYAALTLRDEIARYATQLKRERGLGFSFRMGLNSGEVVVGSIGDDLRMDYTAQGHTVGLAQRMEGLAEPNTCYLTAATAYLARGYFRFDDLGEFQVKGVVAPVPVYRLQGLGESRTRFDLARSQGLSRFVGHAADLRILEDALEQTSAGNSQVVGVVADPGTGKSRLCFEFLERCRVRGLPVFEGRAFAHGRHIPLLPILEVFRAVFDIRPEDDAANARDKISRMVYSQRALESLPLLLDFLGVPDPAHPAPRLEPEVRQRQLIEVLRRMQAGAQRPTVTMLEDLHWLDPASAEFLDHFVEASASSQNFLLLNFRPEYRAEWMQQSYYRQLPLTPLNQAATTELLQDLLGPDPSLAALAGLIHARTGGNPFFTEEVSQALIESGQLIGTRGAYRLVTPVTALEVPATVQAVLAARIDRLPEREKRLLQVAAVIGKHFSGPVLAAVAELSNDELKIALAHLRRAEFIHERALYPIAEYAFKHPLTQEVALTSQLRERRRQAHAAVARVIEQQAGDQLSEQAALLAHHWEEAGEMLVAAHWHRQAAEWVWRTDFAAAYRHWERVRAILRELPDDREVNALQVIACTQLLSLSWRVTTNIDDVRIFFDEGRRLAEKLGDRRALLNLAVVYCTVPYALGDVATYVELARENQEAARELGDLVLEANAALLFIDGLFFAARYSELLAVAEDGLSRFPVRSPTADWLFGINPYTFISMWRGLALLWLGRMDEGHAQCRQALANARDDDAPESVIYALACRAEICCRAGDAAQARADAEEAGDSSRRHGEPPTMVAVMQICLCCAALAANRASDAIAAARTALDIHTRLDKAWAPRSATLLAEALLAAGDLGAQQAAEHAIALSQFSISANYEAIAQGVLARALLRRDGVAACSAAEAALDHAATLIERIGARSLAPALLEWRAELAAVVDDEIGPPKHG